MRSAPAAWAGHGLPVDRLCAAALTTEVDTFAFAASLSTVDVSSDLQPRFSVPVCLATLALDGELAAAGFLPDRLARPEVGALAALVRLREKPVFTAALPHERPTRVTVHWWDGSTASATVRNARGNPDDPLTADEVAAKFRRNVEDVLDPTTADAVVAGLLDGAGGDTMARAAAEVIGRFCP
ncbi:hypothetical protein ABZ403_01410 [Micromonospora zamorensis]|uniref:hypothetical protein n=1 Tax=Micromonospora zamorensis TaxID=709883 RepID=UPI0033CB6ACF